MLRLAIDTHIITNHYMLPLVIKQKHGLVVEMTDGTADYNQNHYRISLFYDQAKTSITRMAWALAQELAPYECHAVALTPGWMRSEIMLEHFKVQESNWQDGAAIDPHFLISESPRFVGRAVAALAQDTNAVRWNGQSLSSGELAQTYGFTDIDGSRPHCFKYMLEVIEAGKAASVTDYR